MKKMKTLRTLALFAIALRVSACSDSGTPVHYTVPDDFHGEIKLIVDSKAPPIPKVDGHYEIVIPASGEVRFEDLAPLENWHAVEVRRASGKLIPTNGGDDDIIWNDGEGNAAREWRSFVGTYKEYRVHNGWD